MTAQIPTFDKIVNSCYDPYDGRMQHKLLLERLEEREGFVLTALAKESEPTEIWVLMPDDRLVQGMYGDDRDHQEEIHQMVASTTPELIVFFAHGLS